MTDQRVVRRLDERRCLAFTAARARRWGILVASGDDRDHEGELDHVASVLLHLSRITMGLVSTT